MTVQGIRMNKSSRTLDGKEAVFYYVDIDGASNHGWFVNEDHYAEERVDGTLDRWIKQLLTNYNRLLGKMDEEKAENTLRQKWETR